MAPMTDTTTAPVPDAASTAQPPVALTIAGSEATGGAGAQADLKTFQELGVFGSLALTCIVSFDPNADWGHRLFPVPQDVLREQLEAITAAHALDAVKIGMLGSPETIATTAEALTALRPEHLVLDPVLICKGQEPGAALDTDEALKSRILPLATFVTPNHFEALSLSGMEEISTVDHLEEAARRIHETSGAVVLAKGGVRLAGAGCTLAAAVAAELAKGAAPLEAARTAKAFVSAGIRQRLSSRAPFDSLWQGGSAAEQ